MIDKLGEWISPLEVLENGSRSLHGVGKGAKYSFSDADILLETLDAPLLALGQATLLRFENQLPDLSQGLHFNLYNNVWGTNFPMWFEGSAQFRFNLSLEDHT